MSLRHSDKRSSERNVSTLAFEDVEINTVGTRMSESGLRRKSSVPYVVIEDSAPERLEDSRMSQLMDDISVGEMHEYEKRDAKDVLSRDPSYTNDILKKFDSLRSYSRTQKRYEKQFQREIEHLLEYQPTAYELAAFHRHMSYTTLWPPLHNNRELLISRRLFYPNTRKERRRIHQLMESRFK